MRFNLSYNDCYYNQLKKEITDGEIVILSVELRKTEWTHHTTTVEATNKNEPFEYEDTKGIDYEISVECFDWKSYKANKIIYNPCLIYCFNKEEAELCYHELADYINDKDIDSIVTYLAQGGN